MFRGVFSSAFTAPFQATPSSSWTPNNLTGLLVWTEVKEGCIFSDVAGTTPSVVGGKIALKKTLKAGLPDRSQSTSSIQPVYDGLGCRYADSKRLTGDAIVLTGPFTAYFTGAFGNAIASGAVTLYFHCMVKNANPSTFIGVHGGSTIYAQNDAGGLISSSPTIRPGRGLLRIRRNSSNQLYYRISGMTAETLIGPLGGNLTIDSEGFVPQYNFSSTSCIDTTLILSQDTVASGDDTNIRAYLETEDPAATWQAAHTRKLIVEGDSISSGSTTPGNEWGWNNQIMHQFSVGRKQYTYAVGGTTMSQIHAAASYNTYGPTLVAGDAVTLMAGTNDNFSGAALTKLLEWATSAKAAIGSASLFICTGLPRFADDSSRLTYNAGIRSNAAGIGYTVVDWGADPDMGQAGQYTDTDWYADAVHPNVAGHALAVERYWLPALNV
jgi:hypothetical protein